MKLTTSKVLDLFQAFTRLDGYARAHETHQGVQVIIESYDLSPTVKWIATTNRHLLRTIKEAFEEKRTDGQRRFKDFCAGLDPKMDPKDSAMAMNTFEATINKEMDALGKEENDIVGLRKMPGMGIRIRGRDPGIIALLDILMTDFIEGEPDYGQPKTPPKKQDE